MCNPSDRLSFTGKQLTRLSTPSGVEMYVWMSIAALEIGFHLAPPPVLFFPSKEISCVSSSVDKLGSVSSADTTEFKTQNSLISQESVKQTYIEIRRVLSESPR